MKTRFTDEPIIQMIKEQEAGEKTADVCRELVAEIRTSGSGGSHDESDDPK